MPLLWELPELACVVPSKGVQALVAVAAKDASTQVSMELAQAIDGAVVGHIQFPGPACRTIARTPLALYQRGPASVAPRVEPTPGRSHTTCIETWVVEPVVTAELVKVGFYRSELCMCCPGCTSPSRR